MLFAFTVPDSPDECTSTPTYDQATGLLQSITVTWDEIPVGFSDNERTCQHKTPAQAYRHTVTCGMQVPSPKTLPLTEKLVCDHLILPLPREWYRNLSSISLGMYCGSDVSTSDHLRWIAPCLLELLLVQTCTHTYMYTNWSIQVLPSLPRLH